MSKKLFSLIKGDKILKGPKGKTIPAKEFSDLLDSKQVLEKVQEDAEDYRKQVVIECESIKEEARKVGFKEGFEAWIKHMAELEKEIKSVQSNLQKLLIPIALKAAKKIVGREIELSEDTIVDIVSNSLKVVSQHKKITVYVNKKDLAALEKNRARLKQIFENLEALSIRERSDIIQGGCVIETEVGIINAQIDNQWTQLERAFEKLLKPKTSESKVSEVKK